MYIKKERGKRNEKERVQQRNERGNPASDCTGCLEARKGNHLVLGVGAGSDLDRPQPGGRTGWRAGHREKGKGTVKSLFFFVELA